MNDTPTSTNDAAQLTMEIVKLAEGYSNETLKRSFQAVLMLRGETQGFAEPNKPVGGQNFNALGGDFGDTKIGPKAQKWIQKNGISRAQLEEIFHLTGDAIEITASEVPGNAKKEMTANCYLLMGVRGLLQFDEPRLNESDAIDLCKRLTAYDKNNHTTLRKNVGNKMTGTKPDFLLTGPGETAAATLIKQMTGV
ncbi:MAG: hypothetical protein M3O03_10870 [Pseudomonadota bacterium]|nr:hypothetical protein [Pseudomonadota bacterium]